jgi:hypothetical protein
VIHLTNLYPIPIQGTVRVTQRIDQSDDSSQTLVHIGVTLIKASSRDSVSLSVQPKIGNPILEIERN